MSVLFTLANILNLHMDKSLLHQIDQRSILHFATFRICAVNINHCVKKDNLFPPLFQYHIT